MNGNDLINMGYEQGPHFGKVLSILKQREHSETEIAALMAQHQPAPTIGLQEPARCHYNITADTDDERDNVEKVRETMDALLRTPIVKEAAIMPDACPAGSVGTIPVGGVVGTDAAIVPGMHSADICCSLMMTVVDGIDPPDLLDSVFRETHFGPCFADKKPHRAMSAFLSRELAYNPYFDPESIRVAERDMGTQGDGNHFAFVGTLQSTGQTVLVTHHGSRGLGARLYKAGKRTAEKFREKLSPETLKTNAWIPLNSKEGCDYWDALQIVRDWTKENHTVIHDAAIESLGGKITLRRWNEHNFVFRDGDTIWHAKGATPIDREYLPDTDGTQIVPLNMVEPVLLIQGKTTANNLGFAPHGAGRNMSRTKHVKSLSGRSAEDVIAEETKGIDARFWTGKHDLSELPSAYKNAASVQADMEKFKLASVVDRVMPYGSIMAGDWEQDAPWKKKR